MLYVLYFLSKFYEKCALTILSFSGIFVKERVVHNCKVKYTLKQCKISPFPLAFLSHVTVPDQSQIESSRSNKRKRKKERKAGRCTEIELEELATMQTMTMTKDDNNDC